MRTQSISNAPRVQKQSFESVLRTDDDKVTQKLYGLLNLNSNKKIDFIKEDYLTIDDGKGPHLILIDDEEGKDAKLYLDLKTKLGDATIELCGTEDEKKLAQMLPKDEVSNSEKKLVTQEA